MHIGAAVLLPEGWDTHPEAKYPLFVYHGHFPATITGWRETPPDPNLAPDYSARFSLKGYNRVQQEYALPAVQASGPGRISRAAIVIEIQHANPFYDDSYAVNSANIGPYGDAIVQELIPYLEQKYRGPRARAGRASCTAAPPAAGKRWRRRCSTPRHSTAPTSPAPIRSTSGPITTVDLYKDKNAYWLDDTFKRTPRPGHRN